MEASTSERNVGGRGHRTSERPGALIRFLRMSRDGWKRKRQEAMQQRKLLANKVADLSKSRAEWRRKAQEAQAELAKLTAKLAETEAGLAEDSKKTPGRPT